MNTERSTTGEVSDAMVERACRSWFGEAWISPTDPDFAKAELRADFTASMRRTLEAAALPVAHDRARETPRRQRAVEEMLRLGYAWNDGAWALPVAAPSIRARMSPETMQALTPVAAPMGGDAVREAVAGWKRCHGCKGKGEGCDNCGGSGWRKHCDLLDCAEHGCGGYSRCEVTKEQVAALAATPAPPTAMQAEGVHTCSLYCGRPNCIRAQRDLLRDGQAEIDRLRADAARLDSGRIQISIRDEFGDNVLTEFSGLNIRAAIDAARARDAEEVR